MAWLAVNPGGKEAIFAFKPYKDENGVWWDRFSDENPDPGTQDTQIDLPDGTIKKIIGYELHWEDDPVDIGE